MYALVSALYMSITNIYAHTYILIAGYWTVIQGDYTRTNRFDGSDFPILTVNELVRRETPNPSGLWLNIQV